MGLFGPSRAERMREYNRRAAERQHRIFANDDVAQMLRLERAVKKWEFNNSAAGRRKFDAAAKQLAKLDSRSAAEAIRAHHKRVKKIDQREAALRAASGKKSSWWF